MTYPKHLNKLIAALTRLPGVGKKTAERYAFQMLVWNSKQRAELSATIAAVDDHIMRCPDCGCFCDTTGCPYCTPQRQNAGILCVLADAKDIFSVEGTGTYQGLYHVLDGLLSPVDGIDTSQLRLKNLRSRIEQSGVKEVVLALDATLEGDTTSLYLKELLADMPIHVSRLAFGLPMGSSFDYIDGSTLARALQGRNVF